MQLSGKKIVLGLTGSIACYKAAEFARSLICDGADVQVVMTHSATQFITPLTMQALTGHGVFTDQWESAGENSISHINLARETDAIVITPCTANFMAKLANGIADDLLSSLCLARQPHIPLMVAPAMNVEMWQNPATRRNLQQLKEDAVMILGPASGVQACGDTGMGRMLEPDELLEEVIAAFQEKSLAGKRVMVTAGPTFEPIDPVRGITNRSSGKMGYAVARAARAAGADVVLVSGPTALRTPFGVTRYDVTTAIEMHEAVMSRIRDQDIFIAVAAVADWKVTNPSAQKIKKDTSAIPALEFDKNPDILASVARLENPPYCVGFAAESEELIKNGEEKRKKKAIPLLAGNIGHETFGLDENELVLFDENGHTVLPRADKQTLARELVQQIAKRI